MRLPTTDKPAAAQAEPALARPWYAGVTRYQWLVLIIASAGWIFDVFEGQIFNLTRHQMLADVMGHGATGSAIKDYGDLFLAVFLLGGTFGGLLFGSLADRWGRRPTMVVTILMYSVFSGVTCLSQTLWEVAAARFLVAMGVGGEWAVGASLVAEVFPKEARAHASGIFHASSVLGVWAAALAGLAVGAHWRYAYVIAFVPALLAFWVMRNVQEPEGWSRLAGQAKETGVGVSPRSFRGNGSKAAEIDAGLTPTPKMGSFLELLRKGPWRRRAVLGMLLAGVGLGTFWAVTVAGQDLARELLIRTGVPRPEAAQKAKFAYGIVEITGMGLGLLAFGPLCVRLGRRPTFALMHAGALFIVPATCYLPSTYGQLLFLLPVFGFLTGGIHAGYAIYFPELFPTRLRATGAAFCFNGGRIVAASALVLSGWLKSLPGMDLRWAITLLGLLYLLGLVIIVFLPETKGQPLPE